MTQEKARELLDPFIKESVHDTDPFFIVHFSRCEDAYKGYHEGLDTFDAIIVVKNLIKQFNLSPLDISVAQIEA